VLLAFFSVRVSKKLRTYDLRFSKILDVDQEYDRVMSEKRDMEESIAKLREDYRAKKAIFDQLVQEAAIFNEEIELAELGFYKPHYEFDTSDEFKKKLEAVKSRQKAMISEKSAIYCSTKWFVEGSEAKGRTMINRGIRLTARAFNNECDAAISNVRWNNAIRMEERITKAFKSINQMNESNAIIITSDYLRLKLEELHLTHEYKEKLQREKEEQAEIRRQMREEAQLKKEVEQAIKEEEKYEQLLAKARSEAEAATGEKLELLHERITVLSKELETAHEKSERAKSMAEQTRVGHIYIISNIGSFGENIYKIGMTRRLDPIERINELGDASVPFYFDVHAMIFSEDAPNLEKSLHNMFDSNRINLVNSRKEFFNVNLSDIEKAVRQLSKDAAFIYTAEAKEYKQSLAIQAQNEHVKLKNDRRDAFPDSI